MLQPVYPERRKPVYIDLRDTEDPIDPHENPWIREWSWLSPIHQRGFMRFEVVDAEVRNSLGRSDLVVTLMDDLGGWYETFIAIEAVRAADLKVGIEGLTSLCRAVGLRDVEDPEEFIGRMGAFAVNSDGLVHFLPLNALAA